MGGWVSVAFEWDSLQTHPNALLSVLARHEMPLRELTTSTCEWANGHAGEEGAVVPYVWVSGFVDFWRDSMTSNQQKYGRVFLSFNIREIKAHRQSETEPTNMGEEKTVN